MSSISSLSSLWASLTTSSAVTSSNSSTSDSTSSQSLGTAAKATSLADYLPGSSSTDSSDSTSQDSYVNSTSSTSLASFLSDNSSDDSGVYSVLTYGQSGQLDLICKKIQSTSTVQSTTPSTTSLSSNATKITL